MNRSTSAALTIAVALVLVVSACGEDQVVASKGDATTDTVAPDAVTLTLSMGAGSVDEAADVVRERLEALGVEGASVEATTDGIGVRVAPEDEDLVRRALQIPGALELRPVLATVGTADGGGHPLVTPPEERVPDAEVVLATEDGSVFRLGPVALDGRALERATAGEYNGMWTVNPVLRAGDAGIDLFNAVALSCYRGEPTCPGSAPDDTGSARGQLAIVVDGVILSAPSINTQEFQRDQISISGSFDEQSARALAAALHGGAPATWSLPD